MRVHIFLILILGIFLTMHGIYEEKVYHLKKQVKVVHKYIPRDSFDQMVVDSFNPRYTYLFE